MVYSVDILSFPSQSCSDRSSLVSTLWLTGFKKKKDGASEKDRRVKTEMEWHVLHGYVKADTYWTQIQTQPHSCSKLFEVTEKTQSRIINISQTKICGPCCLSWIYTITPAHFQTCLLFVWAQPNKYYLTATINNLYKIIAWSLWDQHCKF